MRSCLVGGVRSVELEVFREKTLGELERRRVNSYNNFELVELNFHPPKSA